MIKSFKKIISLLLIIGLNWTGLLAIGQTRAYFNDTKILEDNILQTGILDMTIRSGQGNFTSPAENMNPGDSTARDIYVGKTAFSLLLKHQVSFEFTGGNLDLCDQLDLKIWYDHYECQGSYEDCRDMRLTYNGKLSSLNNYFNADFIIPHPDDWFDLDPSDGTEQWFYYSIVLPDDVGNSYQGKTCNFNFVYEGWQDNMNYGEGGFSDVERISNIISTESYDPTPDEENSKPDETSGPADHIVINEIYGGGGNSGSYWKNDFIELYNASNSLIFLDGWSVQYASKQGNFTNSKITALSGIIPAHGFYLIQEHGGGSGEQILLPVSNASDNINLSSQNGKIALVNNTEAITGKGDSDVVDFVGYGDADEYEGIGAAPKLSNTKSIERGLTGYDDDDNSVDFIIKNNPTATNSIGEGMPDIVINEFLASGDNFDDFVEIYNNSNSAISLSGWMIEVENNNTAYVSDLEGEIKSKDWLLIECLNEDILQADGVITLYDNNDNEIDKISYYDANTVDSSFARIPDGSPNWVDPVPTPGKINTTPENLALAGLNLSDITNPNNDIQKTADVVEENLSDIDDADKEEIDEAIIDEEEIVDEEKTAVDDEIIEDEEIDEEIKDEKNEIEIEIDDDNSDEDDEEDDDEKDVDLETDDEDVEIKNEDDDADMKEGDEDKDKDEDNDSDDSNDDDDNFIRDIII